MPGADSVSECLLSRDPGSRRALLSVVGHWAGLARAGGRGDRPSARRARTLRQQRSPLMIVYGCTEASIAALVESLRILQRDDQGRS